jgi:DNA-binding transcriptional LysR family regulator
VWRVNTVEAAIEAVSRGLCYGWLPRRDVEGRIEQGQLVALPLGAGAVRRIPLVLSFADEEQAGPATRAMAGLLLAR